MGPRQGATPHRMQTLLAQLRVQDWRPGQLEAIEALTCQRRDTWLSLPCGGGKSLVFAAAMHVLGGAGILVEPLQAIAALMKPYLRDRGIEAETLTAKTRAATLLRLCRPRSKTARPFVVIASPEELLHADVLQALQPPAGAFDVSAVRARCARGELQPKCPVSLLAIDEAHVVLAWGETFRPLLAQMSQVLRALQSWPSCAVLKLAMTATATPQRREAVKKCLEFKPGSCDVLRSLRRSNVQLEFRVPVGKAETHQPQQKFAAVLAMLRQEPALSAMLIFVNSRRDADRIATGLESKVHNEFGVGGAVHAYHAKLPGARKDRLRDEFVRVATGCGKDGDVRVLVATIAFGLGVDIHGLHTVVVWDMPASVTDTYQMARHSP